MVYTVKKLLRSKRIKRKKVPVFAKVMIIVLALVVAGVSSLFVYGMVLRDRDAIFPTFRLRGLTFPGLPKPKRSTSSIFPDMMNAPIGQKLLFLTRTGQSISLPAVVWA